nr:Scarecrow-like protein 9 [Ipomoea batatas]
MVVDYSPPEVDKGVPHNVPNSGKSRFKETGSSNEAIRSHSSPKNGDAIEACNVFANGLEARPKPEKGSQLFEKMLKAYQRFTCQHAHLKKISNDLCQINDSQNILELQHTCGIDFGILYGFQWAHPYPASFKAGLVGLSKLRDIRRYRNSIFPNPVLLPAEMIGRSGRRFGDIVRRFGVPSSTTL